VEIDGATIGIVGGVIGATAGVGGGVVGTSASVKNTRTSAARAFMVHVVIAMWIVIGAVAGLLGLALLGVLPIWTYWAVFVPLMCCLGPVIVWTNRRLARLEDGGQAGDGASPPSRRPPRR